MTGEQPVYRRTLLGAGAGAALALGAGTALSPAAAVGAYSAGQIARVQQRLNDQSFWCGPTTGVVNELTTCAILAYQKTFGWTADGILDSDVANALTKPRTAPRFTTQGRVVEVDLKRQILRVVSDGKVVLTLHATTGNNGAGTFGDRAVVNHTPTGKYRIRSAETDIVTNSLGTQYRPHYVRGRYGIYGMSGIADIRRPSTTGGIAVHRDALDLLVGMGHLKLRRIVLIA